MKLLGPLVLVSAAATSLAVAATVPRPVDMPSRRCCDDCTVARYRPANVPSTAPTMVHGAAAIEAGLLALAAGLVLVTRRRPEPPPLPDAAPVPGTKGS